MKPSEIRHELLQQHAEIRTLTQVAQTIAEGVRTGSPYRGDLQQCVARVAEAVRAHSTREEELLRSLVATADAWGTVRVSIMDREHVQAHERLDAALRGIPALPPDLAAVGVIALLRLIREHMDREEAAFLNESVLRDDTVAIGQVDG
jgi:hypothetical protein